MGWGEEQGQGRWGGGLRSPLELREVGEWRGRGVKREP